MNSCSSDTTSLPLRFAPDGRALRLHGPRLSTLAPALLRGDPLADDLVVACAETPGRGFSLLERALGGGIGSVPEAPAALRALLASVDATPAWVDRERQRRGGAVVLRAGVIAGIVLGMKSLMLGYASPGGNKPLVFSGRLGAQAARRLSETSRFVQAVSQPGGMGRFAPGFAITLKVRLMHAQVRRLILASGRWRADLWGVPINQHDMLATVLLFSVAMIDGLRTLGYAVSRDEAEDVYHLWRQVGLVMGVEPALMPAGHDEAFATAEAIRDTQGPPDDDARALASALFAARVAAAPAGTVPGKTAERRRAAMHAVCRLLIGDDLASQMGLPRSPMPGLAFAVRTVARLASRVNRLPVLRQVALLAGDRYWDAAVAEGLGGAAARYTPPDKLAGAA